MTRVERTVNGEATSRLGAISSGSQLPPSRGTSPPRLVFLTGAEQGKRLALDGGVLLGRSEDCDVQLDDGKVSRHHARLEALDDGSWSIEDVGSRNGTLVNGDAIHGPHILKVGDRIQLSHETLLLFTRQDPLEDLLLHRQQMEVIGQLAAGIAHDFNNLLNVVLASVSHVEELPGATALNHAEVLECHADIRQAANRAAELTARLLGLARRKRERGQAKMEVVDVTALCQDVLQLAGRTFGASIRVHSDVAPGLAVAGDYPQLHQVLMNLCINARDAMADGGVLTVHAHQVAASPHDSMGWPAGPQVVISVRDTGIGMEEKVRARVFEPFFSTKESGAGSGLGLATVYEVVTSHGGAIDVESQVGEGSTFHIRLPARVPAGSRPRARNQKRRETWDAGRRSLKRGLIMVVDDQELVRRSLGRLVRAAGHEVRYAADGQEALERYLELDPKPDVVLLDLDMPTLAGEETLARLRQIDPSAKVILVSGYHDESRRRRLLDAGATDFLPKPVNAKKLRDSVQLALRLP